MKKTLCIGFLFAFALVSCAPGSGITVPPDLTLVPGTGIPQQVATYISDTFTQTAVPPATSTPNAAESTLPVGTEADLSSGISSRILYQGSSVGIQFSYPSIWYRQETPGGVFLSSFDPSNPPHKLDWTYETTSMNFGFKEFITPPGSFDDWVESARQTAFASQLTISEEERFSIANQPAHRLSLVSGSGGVINQILTVVNGRYIEINIEGNYQNNLARTVLNSIQPFTPSGIRPADSASPASGNCGEALGDPANIVLGLDGSGMPLAGRCLTINPLQRIRLINQSNGPFVIMLADYAINLPLGGDVLLDRPVGHYLALGVHSLPMGPELWVKDASPVPTITPIPTMPGPFRNYSNIEVGYSLTLPPGWNVDEYGMSNPNKEVQFYPGDAEPFVVYLNISLDSRTLDQIKDFYTQNVPDALFEDTVFNGYVGVKYTYNWGRVEYFIPYQNRLFLLTTDRPNDGNVQQMLGSFKFTSAPIITEVTMADNGRTFVMNVGDSLRLNLDLSYGWSPFSISNPAVLAGAQDRLFAFEAGTATLTTTGDPECLNLTPPCGMPSIIFTITVIVQ